MRSSEEILHGLVDAAAPATSRLRLGIVCGMDYSFIAEIEPFLGEWFDIRHLYRVNDSSVDAIKTLMSWADVTWFEWCDRLNVQLSHRLDKTGPVVYRLHSYEAFTDLPDRLNWEFVDHINYVAPHIQQITQQRFHPPCSSSISLNGINLDKFSYLERQRGFNVAFVANLNYKKNPEMVLQIADELVRKDPRYQVHIAGSFQELRYELYYHKLIAEMGLQNNVVLYGWVENIDCWLEDKSFILSTSLLEGCPLNLVEAMARGLKPVIHNWVGAENLYPSEYRFNTVSEAVRIITDDDYDSIKYRTFVENHYPIRRQAEQLAKIVQGLFSASNRSLIPPVPEVVWQFNKASTSRV